MIVRAVSILALAVIAAAVPAFGENRFILSGILVFICLPLAVWVQYRYPVEETAWSEPLFDQVCVVGLVHIVPEAWYLALIVGASLLGASGTIASRLGYKFYASLMAFFLVGMSFAAYLHDVERWIPAILVLLVLFPTILLYINLEDHRLGRLDQRAQALENLTLLAGGIAHDFNNLLTSVTGNSKLALLELPPNHPAREPLAAAIDSATHASVLTKRLQAFSGRKNGAPTIVDLRTELQVIGNLMQRAVPKGTTINLASTDDRFLVECDQSQVQLVLMNLIMNAAEANTDVASSIKISLTHERSESNDENWIRIEVCDGGLRITREMISSVFNPFVTTKPTSHGLGLANAKRVIEEHGGQFAVESQMGGVTKVQLRLPEARDASEPTATEISRPMTEIPSRIRQESASGPV